MSVPIDKLPDLDLIRTFVAVGRRLSITLAGRDLHLTQSAISRQVRQLEEQLGVRLLDRGFRSIALTHAGLRLFQMADPWVAQLGELSASLKGEAARRPVTITASMGVASLWLLPRLGIFQSRFPHIDVRVAANNRMLDLDRDDVDLALRYGSHRSVPDDAILLFGESLLPVAHPRLHAHRLDSARELANHILLEYDDPQRPWLQWESWLAMRGLAGAVPRGTLRFNQYDQVIHAALAGHGVALGRLPLVAPMLADGRLTALADADAKTSPFSYWLIRRSIGLNPASVVLAEWIQEQASRESLERQGGGSGRAP